ncbi:unnamed protein product [Strongylus vulgaris]|uniref:Uncharacterized protein n=1 Tax=Strongylus vulgaris TaxID=40348 RepID=A0A3P7JQ20_STRVU|nr:unnamed protein product [Strongylus vulgaris]
MFILEKNALFCITFSAVSLITYSSLGGGGESGPRDPPNGFGGKLASFDGSGGGESGPRGPPNGFGGELASFDGSVRGDSVGFSVLFLPNQCNGFH